MYANRPSPIDAAWRTRVTAFYCGAEAAAIVDRAKNRDPDRDGHFADEHKWFGAVDDPAGDGFPETCGEWRLRQWREADAHVEAWRASAPYQARPFRFEDLNGEPEPASWGPVYPKSASQAVEKWRAQARVRELTADESAAYGAAVGTWIRTLNAIKPAPRVSLKYVMPDYAAKCRARFQADAAADKRAWAFGGAKSNSVGLLGLTIEQAYARAMAEKAERLADPEAKLKAAADRAALEAERKLAPIGPKARARLRKLKAAA